MTTIKAAIDHVISAGLSVLEHENNSDTSTGTMHITIVGGKRRVEFYPSTGTAYSNAVKGQFKAVRLPKAGIRAAIKLAMTGN